MVYRRRFVYFASGIRLPLQPGSDCYAHQFAYRPAAGRGDVPQAIELRLWKEDLDLFHAHIIYMDIRKDKQPRTVYGGESRYLVTSALGRAVYRIAAQRFIWLPDYTPRRRYWLSGASACRNRFLSFATNSFSRASFCMGLFWFGSFSRS